MPGPQGPIGSCCPSTIESEGSFQAHFPLPISGPLRLGPAQRLEEKWSSKRSVPRLPLSFSFSFLYSTGSRHFSSRELHLKASERRYHVPLRFTARSLGCLQSRRTSNLLRKGAPPETTDYQPWKRELFAKAQASRVLGLVVEGLYGRWNGSGGRKGLARAIDIVGAPRGRPSIGRQC